MIIIICLHTVICYQVFLSNNNNFHTGVWINNSLINFNSMSTQLGLFYTKRFALKVYSYIFNGCQPPRVILYEEIWESLKVYSYILNGMSTPQCYFIPRDLGNHWKFIVTFLTGCQPPSVILYQVVWESLKVYSYILNGMSTPQCYLYQEIWESLKVL